MKKLIISTALMGSLFAAFLPNKTYNCNTVGISFKDGNQTRNVPNNAKTNKKLKKILKNLYSIKLKLDNKMLNVDAGKASDTLAYLRKYKNLDVYITGDKKVMIFLDYNKTQAGMMIPSLKTMIYYQCK